MGVNQLIAQGLAIPQMESPDERAARKLKMAQDQATFDDMQTKRVQQNELRKFMSTADRNSPTYLDELYRRDPAAAIGEEKSRAELAKANAAAKKDTAETDAKKFDMLTKQRTGLIQGIASVKDRPDLNKSMVISVAQGLLGQGLIDQNMFDGIAGETPDDPAQLREFLSSAQNSLIDAEKQMANATQLSEGAAGRKNQMTIAQMNDRRQRESDALGRQVTMRGQDITKEGQVRSDERARELNAITRDTKPLNEAQSKAALFGSRMTEANKILDTLGAEGTDTSIPGMRAGYGVGAVVNALSSPNQQSLMQAKRDFVNAVLRRESGAVIADSEFENAEKQYFPQVGDSEKVKAQKKANRETAMRGVLIDVPAKQRQALVDEITGGRGASDTWDNEPTKPAAPAGNSVRTPDGQTLFFPSAEAAAKFKKAAGL